MTDGGDERRAQFGRERIKPALSRGHAVGQPLCSSLISREPEAFTLADRGRGESQPPMTEPWP